MVDKLTIDDLVLDSANTAPAGIEANLVPAGDTQPTVINFGADDYAEAAGLQPVAKAPLSIDDLELTPFDAVKNLPIADTGEQDTVGAAFDGLPVLNKQAVPDSYRFLVDFTFDTPEEKAGFLKQELGDDYVFGRHPHDPDQIIMRRKGDKRWGVVNPGGINMKEAAMGVATNADAIAQTFALPSGILGSIGVGAGVQASRQALKKLLLDEADFREDKVVIDGVAGGIAGGVGKAITSTAKAGAKAGVEATRKTTGKLIEDATNPGGILNTIGKKINLRASPESIMREIGASGKEMNPLKANILKNKISKLQKEYPEFSQVYDSAFTPQGKFEALAEYLDTASQNLQKYYTDESIQIPVKEILNSQAYQNLVKAVDTRVVKGGKKLPVKVNQKAASKAAAIRRDFLEDIGDTVLSTSPAGKKYMELYRKNKLHQYPQLQGLGLKTNEDALAYLLQNDSLTLPELVMTRMGRDGVINYNKSAGQIKALETVDKYTADALREALESYSGKIPGGDQLVRDIELVHNLLPVVNRFADTLGQQAAGRWNPIDRMLPGTINSAPRFAAKLGVNLANRTEVRTFLANLQNNPGFALPKLGKNSSLGKSMSVAGRLSRALKFQTSKGILDKALSEEAQAQGLPRDADRYFEQPELFNIMLETAGGTEETDAAVRMLEKGDKEGFANMLSYITSNNPDVFQPAPYNSLTTVNGKPIITDKYEREAHREYILKNVTDPVDRYRQLTALNYKNEMVNPPYEVKTIDKPNLQNNIKLTKKVSPISKTAASLKQSDTVELEDGTEMQDYDY